MLKRILSLTTLLVFLYGNLAGAYPIGNETLDEQLSSSPEVAELQAVFEEMTNRVFSLGVAPADLLRAYERRDEAAVAELLMLTKQEIADLGKRLDRIRESLLAQYPQLSEFIDARATCATCDPAVMADYLKAGAGLKVLTVRVPPGTDCAWAPYTAALVICTGLGPVLYWPCAFVAMCAYCSGGGLEKICGQPNQG